MWNGINRRKFPRANYPCKITIRKKDQPDSLSAQTENIGIGGICLMLTKDLGIFAPVEIQLDIMDGQPNIESEGSIVWVVSKKLGRDVAFDTGIEFTNLKREDESRISNVVDNILREST